MNKKVLSVIAAAGLSLNAMAIDQIDGVYQINTPQDLVDFSAIVNGGNDRAAASLNVDLDMSSVDNFTPIGLYSDNNFPGKVSIPYRGDFRGNGHVIKNLNVVIAEYEVGLFSRTAGGANIHELGVVDSHFESTNGIRVGALGGEMHQSRVYACYGVNNEIVTTKGDDNKGGIAGEAADTNVERCYTDYPRVAGSCRAKDWSHEGVALEKIMSGELCFELNNKHTYTPLWRQDLNGGYPSVNGNLPEVTKLLASDTYTNDHHFVDGVCRECVDFFYDKDYMTPDADGWYNISTPEQLMWFSVYTCHYHQGAKGRLTADIDMAGITDFYGIGEYEKEGGENYPFVGQFNGQGHEVKNLTVYRDDALESGFFGRARGVTISNIGFTGDITVTNTHGIRCGVLGGELLDCTINNVYVRANSITYNTTHHQKGAFAGEAHNSTFNRCFTTEAAFTGGDGTFNACFNNADGFVDAAAETGELCAVLGAGWYQNVDNGQPVDAFPVLDATHGMVFLTCDYSGYSNYSGHDFLNGICQECFSYEEPGFDTDLNAFTIGNLGQLISFSDIVNSDNQSANGSLVADIDMDYSDEFIPIGLNNDGSHQTPFRGTFYGNNHVIRNLYVSTDCEGGLFSRLRGGKIYNLGVENAYIESTANLRCGVIVGEHHDNAIIQNCFVRGEVEFSTAHEQKGGMTGEAAGGHFYNCYTTAGQISYSFPMGGTKTNCYEFVTAEDAQSGELCYKLGSAFRQTLGTDSYPELSELSAPVSYVGEIGYATFYDAAKGYTLGGDIKAYIGKVSGNYVVLSEVGDIPAGTAVVLEGSYYNKVEGETSANVASNEFLGTDTEIPANGELILASVDSVLGFYTANTGTIAAGKAYLPAGMEAKAISFGGMETAIDAIGQTAAGVKAVYNLAGQRLQRVQKGINIVDGKKVMY